MNPTLWKQWAPQCCVEHCTNRVEYHDKYKKVDGTWGFDWKNACKFHRKEGKAAMDNFKLQRGCDNQDGRYGFFCRAVFRHAGQLDIHHVDGNRHNNNPENKEVLCKNCHSFVTLENKDFLNTYTNAKILPKELFDYE